MERIHVYSGNPLKSSALKMETAIDGRFYRNTLFLKPGEEDYRIALDFIFEAIMQAIVDGRLRLDGTFEQVGGCALKRRLSSYFYITGLKGRAISLIHSILSENNVVSIEGIVNFRLQAFASDISAFFDMLFYKYSVQKRYDDFIALVRDYVSLKRPRRTVVHAVFSGMDCNLYDDGGNRMDSEVEEGASVPAFPHDVNGNDFLISDLLRLLPKRIVIHLPSNAPEANNIPILDTITAIFKERSIFCRESGCGFCGERPTVSALPAQSALDDIF